MASGILAGAAESDIMDRQLESGSPAAANNRSTIKGSRQQLAGVERDQLTVADKYGVLKQYFPVMHAFRDGQEKMIDAIASGRDVLGIMPTGAGKSSVLSDPGSDGGEQTGGSRW
ncbi:MAG: hypothetical protein ACLUAR_16860 [Pilosibacter sp.]